MGRRLKLAAAAMAAITGGVSVAGPAVALDQSGRPLSPKRQLIACMNHEMAASRLISYNEATRVCKDQLQAHNALTSRVVAKPITVLGQ